MEAVVRSPPDGYTLVMVALSSAANATLFDTLPFVFLRDIAPVGAISRSVLVMEVHPSVPVATGPDLIAYAKANPNKLSVQETSACSKRYPIWSERKAGIWDEDRVKGAAGQAKMP
jgi:tripartite-type tricarboxylate transporter receptor subunit TctC